MFVEKDLEEAIIEIFKQQNYLYIAASDLHREKSEILLVDDIRYFLLNRYQKERLTSNEVDRIILELRSFSASALYESNKNFLKKLSDGWIFKRDDNKEKDIFIEFLDFENSENNRFVLVNQMEISSNEIRIPDMILYVNGLPLVVFEFKSATRENATMRDAYNQLIIRYKRDIPELFVYNAFVVISDGVNSKMGSIFSLYDFFASWRKVGFNDTENDGINSLFSMINGLFEKSRFLEVVKNFIYFPDNDTKNTKIICRYPQFYATEKLFKNILKNIKPQGNGKGGTYFGTTGCGKSYTMLFLARKLMKSSELQNPTIVIITDRIDLDGQLSEQFGKAKGFIGDENIVSVDSRENLKNLLRGRGSGGIFLTTIHKFTENTDLLSERNNIICISDEAHRSQINLGKKTKIDEIGVKSSYGFAKYLHDSLPNATYVGFTGTPVDGTIAVFGDIVDAYTMKESVVDEITVKIIYEGRASKIFLDNQKLFEIERYYKKCEEEGVNEEQIEASKKYTTKMEKILSDPKRLQKIAEDFVSHYEKRIYEKVTKYGKVMFVCANRKIAFELFKKILMLRPEWGIAKKSDISDKDGIEIEKIKLVMTRGKDDENELFEAIGPKESVAIYDREFKNKNSNFSIAIVVDMWLTGFDVPELDTIYIDKPIQKHTLIQTVSRVNRVSDGKNNGLVVDYIGIKSAMNEALKMYSQIPENEFEEIEASLVILRDNLDLLDKIFYNFDTKLYFSGDSLQKLLTLNNAVEFIQRVEELEKRFLQISKKMRSSFSLCLNSDAITSTERDKIEFYSAVRSILFKLTRGNLPDISEMNEVVEKMIKEAIIANGVEEIFSLDEQKQIDIFDEKYLEKISKIELKNTKIKLLQKLLNKVISEYKKVNKISAIDFSKKLQKVIEYYNERREDLVFASEVIDDVADKLSDLFHEIKNDKNSFEKIGISFEEKVFYDILKHISEKFGFEYAEEKLIILSQEIKKVIDDKTKYTDWEYKEDIKAELKVNLILLLAKYKYPPVTKDEVFREIFEQAENFKKYRNV